MALTRGPGGARVRGRLRTRLVAVTMVITALVVAAVVVLLQVYLARVNDTDATEVARARAAAVAGTVRVADGQVRVLESGPNALDRDVWVFGADGRLVDGRLPAGDAGAITRLGARPVAATASIGEQIRLVARPVVAQGRPVATVVAGVDLTPYEHAERRGLWLSSVLGLLTVLAAGVAAWEAARHALGHVHSMVRSAQDWEEHDLDRRFGLGPPVDEITELGQTLDHMLDRIADALHTERRLSDEMAHELRTPLAVIRAEAELALATAGPAGEESLRAIVEAAGRLDGVVGSMLDAARSRHDREATCEMARVLAAVARDAAYPVEVRVRPVPAGLVAAAAPAVVRAALTPLLDNAARHARSRVELDAQRRGTRVVVAVHDDGPGLAAAEVDQVFRPGHRGEGGGTAGLGLAVVGRLVESVGGSVRALPGPGGCFEVELPGGE
ncbi:sensor histidine kinase [Nocardioides panaciterrulae]|uniref:histidine kinase n=1 Tax=Nocardioides panaciterrulae TaxID=661492 RepID=A0A7Y9EA74_9ACTN|nr:HAMP domain-containing sensor histidine kinase [Nocardioides panaciterrulae]NYD43887.1 signal transduction histidine kinase [Nocardioides panaciterrulae]